MIPARFEKDALHTAAATLPRAIEVKAIDDWTVEGSSVKNRNPPASVGVSSGRCATAIPSSGNSAKVVANTARCSRQLRSPCTIASRDSRAPCRKNSSTIPASAAHPNHVAARPTGGSSEARRTVPSSISTNGSNTARMRRTISAAGTGRWSCRPL